MDAVTDPALEHATDAFRSAIQSSYGQPSLAFASAPATPYPGLTAHQAIDDGGDESKDSTLIELQQRLQASHQHQRRVAQQQQQQQQQLQQQQQQQQQSQDLQQLQRLQQHEASPSISSASEHHQQQRPQSKRKSVADPNSSFSPSSPSAAADGSNPRKKSKVSQACDRCRTNKMRCGRDITSSEEDCGNCKKAKTVCQYARTPRKRGPIRGHVKELNDRVRALEAKVQGRGLGHEHDGGEVGTSLKGDDGSTGRSRAGSQQQQGMNLSGVSGGDDSFLELQSLPYFNGPGPGQREQQQQQQQFVLPSNHMPGMDQSVMAADASAIGLNTNSSLLAAIANMGSVEATDPQLLIERGVQGAERLLDMLRAAAVEAAAAGSGGEHEMAASASASASASAIGGGIGTRHTGVSSLHSLQHLAELAVGDDRDAERQHAQAIAVAMVSIDKEMRAVKEGVLASIRGGTVRGF